MKNSKISIAAGLVILLASAGVSSADTLYVPSQYSTIQGAIDASSDSDQIEVAPGTYNESINFSGKAVRLYSSAGAAVTTINANGAAHAVQCISGEDADTILEGFTVTGASNSGMFNSSSSPTVTNCTFSRNTTGGHGGGIYNFSSSPTVTNCAFYQNTAGLHGGGIMNNQSCSPRVINCIFAGNTAGAGGGGLANSGNCNATLTNCTFTGNSAISYGGAIYNWTSSPTLTGCSFTGNSSDSDGGGLYNHNNSNPKVNGCSFAGNTADSGGGMSNYGSSPAVSDCTFSGNSANHGDGGGMFNSNNSRPTVTNCSFSGNTANEAGGGMFIDASGPIVTNCTFTGNTASDTGGGMFNVESGAIVTNCTFSQNTAGTNGGGMFNIISSPDVTNCVFWADHPDEIYNDDFADPLVTYSNVMGGFPGIGNIDADPCFIDADAGNLRLKLCSPCIDAGSNAAVPAGVLTDADGRPRFLDDPYIADTGVGIAPIVDMGAYELSAIFGTVNGKNVKLTMAGCDGNNVTFALTGGGFGLLDPYDCNFSRIDLFDTTIKSSLKISTKVKDGVSVGNIICKGPMKSIAAKGIDLKSCVEIGAPAVPNPKAAVTITFDQGKDLSIASEMPLKSISATQWKNGTLNAPSVGSITAKSDKKRGLLGELYIDVEVDGNIGAVKVKDIIFGDWLCSSIKSISAIQLYTANITLNQPPDAKVPAIGKVTAVWIYNSKILSQGNIGTISAGVMTDSSCFAGIAEGITGLPAAQAATFAEPATIKSIAIKCRKGEEYGYENSNIAAANILNASIACPNNDNGSEPFGITADYIKKLTIKNTDGSKTSLKEPKDTQVFDDLEIRLY